MARRVLKVERLIAVLGVAVLALGAVILWLVSRNGVDDREITPRDRALRQLRQSDPSFSIIYTEDGRTPGVVCGFASVHSMQVEPDRPGAPPPPPPAPDVFVSRKNRLFLSTDPLKAEFAKQLRVECPGLPVNIPRKL